MAHAGDEKGGTGKLTDSLSGLRATVTRVEVIDHRKAAGDKKRHVIVPASDAACEVELGLQDDGRTLKIFIKDA